MGRHWGLWAHTKGLSVIVMVMGSAGHAPCTGVCMADMHGSVCKVFLHMLRHVSGVATGGDFAGHVDWQVEQRVHQCGRSTKVSFMCACGGSQSSQFAAQLVRMFRSRKCGICDVDGNSIAKATSLHWQSTLCSSPGLCFVKMELSV
ncbi:unnamed protein product [Ostreobium quekettii]|uniref:Secreted protein n=1 Tax=Ostreobium quekettii TaxID=121088 RepID=A0A8S1IU18_9CHLO|nr:unnamed protein product [Ostreobium quekettii]